MFVSLLAMVSLSIAATWTEAESRLLSCHADPAAAAWFDLSERVATEVAAGRLDENDFVLLNERTRELTAASRSCRELESVVADLEASRVRGSSLLAVAATALKRSKRGGGARSCGPSGASCDYYRGETQCCSGACMGMAGIRWGLGPHRCY